MIVKEAPTFWELMFSVNGSIVVAIAPKVLFACILSIAVCLGQEGLILGSDALEYNVYFGPFAALGVAISLFLGFRNNACYDRWWEGRKQLGQQLVDVRNFTRIVVTVAKPNDAEKAVHLVLAHVHALAYQLRPSEPSAQLALDKYVGGYVDEAQQLAKEPQVADALLRMAAKVVQGMGCDSITTMQILHHLDRLGGVQGACERIAVTPLPYTYTLLIHRTTYMYIMLAPFAIVADMHWVTPLFTSIIAYTFFGLDELSRCLENPFGVSSLGLALQAMARNIEITALAGLLQECPPPIRPDENGLLM
jgi:putative membrane protein